MGFVEFLHGRKAGNAQLPEPGIELALLGGNVDHADEFVIRVGLRQQLLQVDVGIAADADGQYFDLFHENRPFFLRTLTQPGNLL